MDEERDFELRQLEQHAIEYGEALENGFEGDYETYIRKEKK